MLILSMAAVSRGAVRLQQEVPPEDAFWDGTDLAPLEPLRVDLAATAVGEGILVRGDLETTLQGGCRRCLEPVSVKVRDSLDLLYEPLTAEEEVELSGEVYPLPGRGDELDLAPAIREQLVLRVPDFVVCAETCRGLCPQCGVNLNQTTCSCVPEAGGSPWDALKDIRFED